MSQNIVLLGPLEMLHSLYEFKATYAKTLSFRYDEYFILHQTNSKHKNWWEVINEEGELGFIPSNYVETVTVNPSFLLKFLDTCIKKLQKRPTNENSSDRKEVMTRIAEVRKQIVLLPEMSGGGDDIQTVSYKHSDEVSRYSSSHSSVITDITREVDEEPIEPIQNATTDRVRKSIENIHEEVNSEVYVDGNKSDCCSPTITHQAAYELIENVRINTQLSHDLSKVAVVTVIQGLHELLPASVFPYLSTVITQVESAYIDKLQIDQTHDASRLRIIFTELTSCKEDSEQRSWMLHEDEDVIKEYILELIQILSNADTNISRHVISSDQYHFVVTLTQYYQMEIRWSIRQLLLQTFGVLCSLDKTVINIMLNSILPGELARDMMANARNIPKLNYSSILLTMIFSMGEPMPITHHDLLDTNFLMFLLNNIEYPPDTDVDEQIPDLFINCILSFNLQFEDNEENPLLNALEQVDVTKSFTEKILLLFNRELDPVRIFVHEPAPQHSVLKLVRDMLSRKSTANLFYTNDLKVLIDIVVRNITDLSPGDPRRREYLELCRRTLRNTNYQEYRYRIDEILRGFTRIFCEDNEMSATDQKIVREISHEFPDLF